MDDRINELQSLVKELRDKFEAKQDGLYTKAEFEEFAAKVNARIDELETKLQRPAIGTNNEPDDKQEAFLKYVRHGLSALEPNERKALVETGTVGSGGEILVPEALMETIFSTLPKFTIMRRLANVRQIGTDRARIRTISEPTVSWGKLEKPSTPALTLTESSGFTPGEKLIWIEDLYGLLKIGEDELMDTDVSLQSLLVEGFSRAISHTEDMAFVNGTGHADGRPVGILSTEAAVPTVETTTINTFAVDDLFTLIYDVAPEYRTTAAILVHPKTEMVLRLAKSDTLGMYLWQPSLAEGTPPTFAGYPIYNHEALTPATDTSLGGKAIAIFGDFRQGYLIVDRLAMTVQRLDELYAEAGLVGFKAHFRVGGGVVDANALRILKVKSSP